jgi:hypothetical protein
LKFENIQKNVHNEQCSKKSSHLKIFIFFQKKKRKEKKKQMGKQKNKTIKAPEKPHQKNQDRKTKGEPKWNVLELPKTRTHYDFTRPAYSSSVFFGLPP